MFISCDFQISQVYHIFKHLTLSKFGHPWFISTAKSLNKRGKKKKAVCIAKLKNYAKQLLSSSRRERINKIFTIEKVWKPNMKISGSQPVNNE